MKQKRFVVVLILAFLVLIFNFLTNFFELIDYEKRVNSGNARWEQVEERIVNIENEVNILKREVEKWKN